MTAQTAPRFIKTPIGNSGCSLYLPGKPDPLDVSKSPDHTLSTHPSAKGVLDYWKDATGDEWVVKGWAAESTLFVMFVYGPEAYPNYIIVDTFFKGARFKGD